LSPSSGSSSSGISTPNPRMKSGRLSSLIIGELLRSGGPGRNPLSETADLGLSLSIEPLEEANGLKEEAI
jgi:hypothetical protein